ncbi:MAG: transcriptional repressor [Peptoniphilaceae bacterium]|nr:transcriptional repressor [Peptoniphilaceae bacterium]MDD7383486.1 transcriptional repressor [Peptoniphilaceae bacterium]MDY3738452.1 transcriptional repressor [Peptoniphilaceae bacterium]
MNLEELKILFEKNDYKFTKQREIIFEALNDSHHRHITPEELYTVVHKKNSSIGIATVYRTLSIFENLGIVKRQEFEDQVNRYELIRENDHHDHLICTSCGKISEVKIFPEEKYKKLVEDKYNFEMQDYSLKIYGLCHDCRNKEINNKEN